MGNKQRMGLWTMKEKRKEEPKSKVQRQLACRRNRAKPHIKINPVEPPNNGCISTAPCHPVV